MPQHAKRSITISGHRTSVSLEPIFWDALRDIASNKRISISRLVQEIDAMRSLDSQEAGQSQLPTSGLSSAIRIYVLEFYKALADRNGSSETDDEATDD